MTHYSGKDLARSFRTVRKNTIQTAHDIPEDKFNFRATNDTRTVAETFAHIATTPSWQHKLHGVDKKTAMTGADFGAYIGPAHAHAEKLTTKKDIVHALETEGETFAKFLEEMPDSALAEHVALPGDPASKTRFEMLLGVKEHEMHHRAQLMLMQRMLGIVPHLTKARQAR